MQFTATATGTTEAFTAASPVRAAAKAQAAHPGKSVTVFAEGVAYVTYSASIATAPLADAHEAGHDIDSSAN